MTAKRFLLDTHVAVTLGNEGGFEGLPVRVQRILMDTGVELLLSVVSEIEIAIKSGLGKLDMSKDQLAAVCANGVIVSYPLRHQHADKLFALPMHHKDPFDRMIIATALSDDLPVISEDGQFREYKGLTVIW